MNIPKGKKVYYNGRELKGGDKVPKALEKIVEKALGKVTSPPNSPALTKSGDSNKK